MSLYQLTLHIHAQDIPLFELFAERLEPLSITYLAREAQEAIYEPDPQILPKWHRTKVQLLLDTPPDAEMLYAMERELGICLSGCTCEKVLHQDWQKIIIAATKPLYFGERLVIGPKEHLATIKSRHTQMVLAPGLAFGTGSHPTTYMCLQWLGQNHPVDHMIDYGCGSGILAIAALLLGSKMAVAVDIDAQALTATRNNAINNHITGERLHTFLPRELPVAKTPLLIANILTRPLVQLAPLFAALVATEGRILLTGILLEQKDLVYDTYMPWFDISLLDQQEGWVLLAGKRKSSVPTHTEQIHTS